MTTPTSTHFRLPFKPSTTIAKYLQLNSHQIVNHRTIIIAAQSPTIITIAATIMLANTQHLLLIHPTQL